MSTSSDIDAPAAPTLLETATAERDQFKDMALRIQADFENYRKRSAGIQADEVDRATGRVVESLLPVLDACEAAFSHGADGVEPIWSSLLGVLQKQGLEVLDLADQPFDPALASRVRESWPRAEFPGAWYASRRVDLESACGSRATRGRRIARPDCRRARLPARRLLNNRPNRRHHPRSRPEAGSRVAVAPRGLIDPRRTPTR